MFFHQQYYISLTIFGQNLLTIGHFAAGNTPYGCFQLPINLIKGTISVSKTGFKTFFNLIILQIRI